MTDATPPAADTEDAFPGKVFAFRLGIALLAGLLLVVVTTRLDHARRGELEEVAEVTAVGDTHYFVMPADPAETSAVVIVGGKPLMPVVTRKFSLRETGMRRVAVNEETGLAIYEATGEALAKVIEEAGKDGAPFYFLKIGTGDFIRLRASEPVK